MSLLTQAAEAIKQARIRSLRSQISSARTNRDTLIDKQTEYKNFVQDARIAINHLEFASTSLGSAKDQVEKSYDGYRAEKIKSTMEGNRLSISSVIKNLNAYIETAEKKIENLEEKINNLSESITQLSKELSSLE